MEGTSRQFVIREAREEDCGLILAFIRELAEYERRPDMVKATEEILRQSLFVERRAEVLIGEEDGVPVAFALFFHNFSTFVGRAGIYLEDLLVKKSCRGRGYGRAMFEALARIAVERGCERFDWSCLDWNKSSIAFYHRMGAERMEEWVGFRLSGEGLRSLAAGGSGQADG